MSGRERQCVPQTTRAMGARVDRHRGTARLFVPTEQGARVLEDVRPGVALAATFVRIDDYRAVQIKGEIAGHRACDEDERQGVLAYRDGFAQACGRVGMPLGLAERLVYWPCACVEVAVGELFAQTPGPNAVCHARGGRRVRCAGAGPRLPAQRASGVLSSLPSSPRSCATSAARP